MAFGLPGKGVPPTAEKEKIAIALFNRILGEGGNEPSKKTTKSTLAYSTLTDWFMNSSDKAALPWQLLLWRHCPARSGEAGSGVDNAVGDDFVLDLKNPQAPKKQLCPAHGEDVGSCRIPKREEVLTLHIYYAGLAQLSKSGSSLLTTAELAQALEKHAQDQFADSSE